MWPLDWPYSVKASHWFNSLEHLQTRDLGLKLSDHTTDSERARGQDFKAFTSTPEKAGLRWCSRAVNDKPTKELPAAPGPEQQEPPPPKWGPKHGSW